MNNAQDEIIVVGSANMDMVVKTKCFPQPGETVFGHRFGMFPGGKGANQAVCCARLGGKTHFIGKMGNDIFKDQLKATMQKDGVLLDGLQIESDEATGIALITVDEKAENEIVVVSGSNMKLMPADVASSQHLFAGAAVVLVQLEIPLSTVQTAAELARRNNAIFMLNPAPAQKLPEALFPHIDYLTPNKTELEILTQKKVTTIDEAKSAAMLLLNCGVKNVVVTLGKSGALLVNQDAAKLFGTRQVKAVDSTAAGDAFNGALAFSLARGEKISDAICFANVVASYSVTKMGAQSSIPYYYEIQGLIKDKQR